jgi:hypothetical protein
LKLIEDWNGTRINADGRGSRFILIRFFASAMTGIAAPQPALFSG